jgi:hypothetical protein
MPPNALAPHRAGILRKTLYFLIGLLLLPACGAVAYSTFRQVATSGDFRGSIVFFLIGFTSYLIFFVAFRKPLRPYLLGHELTHALWVVLFRGKVHEIRLSEKRGQVKATKLNTFIALAPYFFPFYTVLVIVAYGIATLWVNFGIYHRLVLFAIGFTWSFHLLLNLYMLQRGQEDLRVSGRFFSLVVILLLNLIVLGLILGFIAEGITFKSYLATLAEDVIGFYKAVVEVVRLSRR